RSVYATIMEHWLGLDNLSTQSVMNGAFDYQPFISFNPVEPPSPTSNERTDVPASADGIDRLEFIVQTNPGSPAGPLVKVASGGEFSRFLLALKVCLADQGSASTMIFDEIDTGVGGAVSDAIGARMARLSDAVQVIAVTHAPQVAARADQHLLIAKSHKNAATATAVAPISGTARREEIARMLAGATITDEARAAADRLIEA
ncbi:MAG: hypothetical protein AAF615_03850, partial [Pseudomonadota bacterium]